MKRFLSFLLIAITSTFIFAQGYQIIDVNYDIEGCKGISFGKTNRVSLEIKCPVDTNTVFTDTTSLEKYINEYKQRLTNLRAFSSIELSYDGKLNESTQVTEIILNVKVTDSSHLLAVPYPKYDTNDGLLLKLKAKDSNFLGTLNPLSSDIYVNYKDRKNEWKFGINFSYNYPFKAGIFNASWNNSFSIDYTIGTKKPASSTNIGVSFSLPKQKYAVNFGFNQAVNYNVSNSNMFKFTERLNLSTPFYLYKLPNYSTVTYSPNIYFYFDWNEKTQKVDKENFRIEFGHSLSNSKVNWNNRFRKGYSLSLSNSYVYYFYKDLPFPLVSLEAKGFYNFKMLNRSFLDRAGINSRLYAFTVIDVPGRGSSRNVTIGGRMRGILNDQVSAPYGVVLNLDLPINIYTTHFSHDFFNFTMQFSPFVDMALTNTKEIDNFNLSTKNLCAGMEVLVYPHHFSSYTIRGSIGFDIKEVLHSANKLKGLWQNKEIYIGLDLHY